MVLGNTFNAEQALSYGITNQTCQPEELLALTADVAQTIANLPVESVMTSRKLIRQANKTALSQIMSAESQAFLNAYSSQTAKHFFFCQNFSKVIFLSPTTLIVKGLNRTLILWERFP